ncbi:MAG: aldehyde dehydrogenase family protein [Cyclobacteriaceae bacterium]
MQKILNYVNGKLIVPASGKFLDNYNPSEGKVYSLVADSDERDVNEAANAAKKAFPAWAAMSLEERCKILLRVADLIDRDLEKLALAESIDNGKTIKLARAVDIYRASANMKFYATAAQHFASEAHVNDGDSVNYTTRMPIGVVGCISPWNLPLYLFTWKIAPALAAGCTVVGKPSELTPMTAFLFSQLCIEAGLPAGVLNIIHGLGGKAGQAIIEHPGNHCHFIYWWNGYWKKNCSDCSPNVQKTFTRTRREKSQHCFC